jgi:transposase-like protein
MNMEKEEKMYALNSEQEQSGETVKAFAQKHGISYPTWYKRRKKYRLREENHRPKLENLAQFKELIFRADEKAMKNCPTPKIEIPPARRHSPQNLLKCSPFLQKKTP